NSAADHLKVRSCLIDGEAVACDKNGLAVFERLRRRPSGKHVFLYAFDLLELDGQDLRREPLETRKCRPREARPLIYKRRQALSDGRAGSHQSQHVKGGAWLTRRPSHLNSTRSDTILICANSRTLSSPKSTTTISVKVAGYRRPTTTAFTACCG